MYRRIGPLATKPTTGADAGGLVRTARVAGVVGSRRLVAVAVAAGRATAALMAALRGTSSASATQRPRAGWLRDNARRGAAAHDRRDRPIRGRRSASIVARADFCRRESRTGRPTS